MMCLEPCPQGQYIALNDQGCETCDCYDPCEVYTIDVKNINLQIKNGKFSVSDRHPMWPKMPKTSIIDIALHVCEVISEGKLQMSE